MSASTRAEGLRGQIEFLMTKTTANGATAGEAQAAEAKLRELMVDYLREVGTVEPSLDAHYAAIGRVVAAWSLFEAIIDNWWLTFAGLKPEVGVRLTAKNRGSGAKLKALISLCRHRGIPTDLLEALNDFKIVTLRLNERRNRTMHDIWFLNPTVPSRLEVTVRGKLVRIVDVPTSAEELLAFADEIMEHVTLLEMIAGSALAKTAPTT
jgi:hypothetical protein